MDLFETAVFTLSCGRVKTELFENADVTASIHYVSEHAHGSLGVTPGHFACLFSLYEARTSKVACSSVFGWTEIFSKTLLVWTRIIFHTDKTDISDKTDKTDNIRIFHAFPKYPDTCGRGLSLWTLLFWSKEIRVK